MTTLQALLAASAISSALVGSFALLAFLVDRFGPED